MKYLVDLDLNKNEIQNVVIQNLDENPSNPATGQIWYLTTTNEYMYYNGTEILPVCAVNSLSLTMADDNGKVAIQLNDKDGNLISKIDVATLIGNGELISASLDQSDNLIINYSIFGHTEQIVVDLSEVSNEYYAKNGGGILIDNNNEISINNSVTPNSSLNTDKEPSFGDNMLINFVNYNANGLITGVGNFNIRIPSLSGTVGQKDTYSKLITYLELNNSGELTGQTIDITKVVDDNSTDNQIPTARAVNNELSKWTSI